MKCKNCGAENAEGQIFCKSCGARLSDGTFTHSMTFEKQDLNNKKDRKKLIIACLVVANIIVFGVLGLVLFNSFSSGSESDEKTKAETRREEAKEDKKDDAADEGSESTDSKDKFSTESDSKKDKFTTAGEEEEELPKFSSDSSLLSSNYDTLTEEEKFNYTLQWLNNQNPNYKLLDYTANEQTPNTRDTSLEWDRTLFYSLEDVSPTDSNDGKINFCNISKVYVKNKATDNLVECEIYKEPNTNKIQKIVTIEKQKDTGLYEIWEYYYENDKVNFIFYSLRDIYTPTYATPDKCGERYYYNNSSLVKFRRIEVPLEVQDFLVADLASYEPHMVEGYNNLEIVGLTRAYNVFETVQNTPIYGTLSGYIYDTNNNPITGATVKAHNEHYGKATGEVKTNEEGYYSIMVPSDVDGEYKLQASNGTSEPVDIYGVKVDEATTTVNNENVYIPSADKSEETIDIEIMLCDAFNTMGGGDSYSNMQRLPYATLNIRKGVNNKNGEIIATYQADGNGMVYANLKLGMYTGEISVDGYEKSYFTIAAKPDNIYMQSLTTPKLNDGEVRIVLTWDESPSDLDSHLFTPYQGEAGDMQHIGFYNPRDAYGNNLDVDDTSGYGPETTTITNITQGNYKYYVSDYSNLSMGYPDSYAMSNSRATVRVYTSNGLAATFHVPENQSGTIWEVFEIRNKKIIPIQRYYSYVEDKSWWARYN